MVEGKLQKADGVIHVIAHRCFNASKLLREFTKKRAEETLLTLSRADETPTLFTSQPNSLPENSDQLEPLRKARNFK